MKQRLIGAAVLVGLAVIFVPMLVDKSTTQTPQIQESNIPPPPTPTAGEFTSKIVPLEPAQPVTPVVPAERAGEAPTISNEQPKSTPAKSTDKKTGAKSAVPEVPPASLGKADESGKPDKQLAAGVQAWVVQLGSFASEQNATELSEKLQKQGYAAFVEKLNTDAGVKFRVRVGPELVRDKAEQARQRLEKDLNLKGMVVRYP
ncbi:MAG: SPOR domain-containing protein [Gammaproteobacteria bacterium]